MLAGAPFAAQLERLSITDSDLTDDGAGVLAATDFAKLVALDVGGSELTEDGFDTLAALDLDELHGRYDATGE